MIYIFYLIFYMSFFSMSLKFKSALSLIVMLEIFLLNFLLFLTLSPFASSLNLYSISFLLMSVGVLAATMGLCVLISFSKSNFFNSVGKFF